MAFGVVVVPKVLRLLLVAVCSVHKPRGQGSSLLCLSHRTGSRLRCLQSRLQAGLGCRQGYEAVCAPPAVAGSSQRGAHGMFWPDGMQRHAAPRRHSARKHTLTTYANITQCTVLTWLDATLGSTTARMGH